MAELAAAGLTPADLEAEVVFYWPENAGAVHLFLLLDTQWRAGMGGRYGLDYAAMYPLMDRLQLDADEWLLLFADMRTLESAALAAMHKED